MAISNTTIVVKKSATPGNTPSVLANGELALNYADGKLYYKNVSGSITYISSGATTNSFATINANSSLILATSNTDTLSLVPGNNITIVANTTAKSITFSLSNNISISGNVITNTTQANNLIVTNASGTANVSTNIIQSTIATTAQTTIDTWSTTTYRTAKYLVQMTQSTNYHTIELLLIQNGTTANLVQYGEVFTSSSLGTFDASISGSTLSLLINPTSATSMTINLVRDTISV
jgi:hypothetical protein